MNQNAAVNAHTHIAEKAAGPEPAGPADHQKFARGCFRKGRIRPGKAGGTQERGEQLSLPEHIQALLQLVDDQPIGLIDFLFLQEARFHIALKGQRPNPDGGTFLTAGISLHQRPFLSPLQHVHALAGTGDHAGILLTGGRGLLPDPDLLPLGALQHGDRLRKHPPDGLLVHAAHLQIPEAIRVIAAVPVDFIGGEILHICCQQGFSRFRQIDFLHNLRYGKILRQAGNGYEQTQCRQQRQSLPHRGSLLQIQMDQTELFHALRFSPAGIDRLLMAGGILADFLHLLLRPREVETAVSGKIVIRNMLGAVRR